MRSTRKPDLDDVCALFEDWRGRAGRRTIPDELWLAAASLLDRHTANAICERLRLNESRFRQMRDRLGVAPHRRRRRGATDSKTEAPRHPAAHVTKRKGSVRAAAIGPVTTGERAAPAAFIDLGAMGIDPIGRVRSVAGDGAPACSLTIERPDGLRVRFEWPAADASAIGSVCEVLLGGDRPQRQPDHPQGRRRR